MAVYDKKNKLVEGDPNKVHTMLEYVVFQKTITNTQNICSLWKSSSTRKINEVMNFVQSLRYSCKYKKDQRLLKNSIAHNL